MKNRNWILLGSLSMGALALASPELAHAARDLTSAAQAAVTTTTTIARVASVFGIVFGALVYQIPGAGMFAKSTIFGGIIGAVLTFGGPSIIGFLQGILGG